MTSSRATVPRPDTCVRIVDEPPDPIAGVGAASVGALVGAPEARSGKHRFEVAVR